eukprot:TRINITY_DN1704_c0_g1_i1.p1 TRINITY_DN1704_c0_g1~~TRINITY_DN1704_c0_g1_i1.p1  ORF type:complete len:734 (+),score=196.56 TRINITY_DN1704_c0_g1_i1:31-2202(+)
MSSFVELPLKHAVDVPNFFKGLQDALDSFKSSIGVSSHQIFSSKLPELENLRRSSISNLPATQEKLDAIHQYYSVLLHVAKHFDVNNIQFNSTWNSIFEPGRQINSNFFVFEQANILLHYIIVFFNVIGKKVPNNNDEMEKTALIALFRDYHFILDAIKQLREIVSTNVFLNISTDLNVETCVMLEYLTKVQIVVVYSKIHPEDAVGGRYTQLSLLTKAGSAMLKIGVQYSNSPMYHYLNYIIGMTLYSEGILYMNHSYKAISSDNFDIANLCVKRSGYLVDQMVKYANLCAEATSNLFGTFVERAMALNSKLSELTKELKAKEEAWTIKPKPSTVMSTDLGIEEISPFGEKKLEFAEVNIFKGLQDPKAIQWRDQMMQRGSLIIEESSKKYSEIIQEITQYFSERGLPSSVSGKLTKMALPADLISLCDEIGSANVLKLISETDIVRDQTMVEVTDLSRVINEGVIQGQTVIQFAHNPMFQPLLQETNKYPMWQGEVQSIQMKTNQAFNADSINREQYSKLASLHQDLQNSVDQMLANIKVKNEIPTAAEHLVSQVLTGCEEITKSLDDGKRTFETVLLQSNNQLNEFVKANMNGDRNADLPVLACVDYLENWKNSIDMNFEPLKTHYNSLISSFSGFTEQTSQARINESLGHLRTDLQQLGHLVSELKVGFNFWSTILKRAQDLRCQVTQTNATIAQQIGNMQQVVSTFGNQPNVPGFYPQ